MLEYFGKCPHLMSEMFPLNQLISFSDEGKAGVGCVLEYFGKCPHLMSGDHDSGIYDKRPIFQFQI